MDQEIARHHLKAQSRSSESFRLSCDSGTHDSARPLNLQKIPRLRLGNGVPPRTWRVFISVSARGRTSLFLQLAIILARTNCAVGPARIPRIRPHLWRICRLVQLGAVQQLTCDLSGSWAVGELSMCMGAYNKLNLFAIDSSSNRITLLVLASSCMQARGERARHSRLAMSHTWADLSEQR